MAGNDRSDNSGSNSSAEFDARMYKLMFEFDRRLDEKFKEARAQNKEDIKTAIEIAVNPIIPRLDNIDNRLEKGEKQFEKEEKRLSEHSERIDDVNALLAAEGFGPNGRKPHNKSQEGTTAVHKKPEGGWISADKLPSIIAAVGSVVALIISSIAMLRNPQQAQQTSPPAAHAPANNIP